MKKKVDTSWVIKIIVASIAISMVFSFASAEILGGAGYIVAFAVLAAFIAVGILFDIIGVSVTAASPAPFHSMASHHERGALEALRLLKNAEKVSSFCNDVVGDISGIVSGATAATIVSKLMIDFSTENVLVNLAVSGLVAGLTIGGKAVGKTVAMNRGTEIILFVGKTINLCSSVFRRR